MSYPSGVISIPRGVYESLPRSMPLDIGFSNWGLTFDAAALDDVRVLDNPTLDVTTELTAGCFIRTTLANTIIMSKWRAAPGGRAWFLSMSVAGLLTFQVQGSGGADAVISTRAVNDGRIHHVLGRFDNGFADVWIDRVFNNSKVLATPDIDVGIADVYLARLHAGVYNYYAGFQDENKIYGRAITDEEIKYNALDYHNPVRLGLVMHLRMEEGQGLALHDYSETGNNGVITGADWTRVEKWELRGGANL